MSKRIVCLAIALVLLTALFTGCGSSKGPKDSASSGSTEKSTSTQSTGNATSDANSEAFTITISSWFMGDLTDTKINAVNIQYTKDIEAKYKEKYPNATIQWDNLGNEKYMDVLKAKYASGSAADVTWHQLTPVLAKAGYLLDLSDMPFVADMLDATKGPMSYQGKVYTAPVTVYTFGTFYNKKIFADNGIEVPKNWNEFLAVCEKLKAKGIAPLLGGFKDNWVLQDTFQQTINAPFTFANNPNFEVDIYNGKAKINSPEYKNSFDKLFELISKGYFDKAALSHNWDQSRADFEAGKGAMLIQGNWLPGMIKTEKPDMEVGFFPMTDENGKTAIPLGVDHGVSINAKSSQLDRAKDLFNVLIDKDILATHLSASTSFPGMKSVEVKFDGLPAMDDVMNALKSFPTVLPGGTYLAPSAIDDMNKVLTKMAAGQKYTDADLNKIDADNIKDHALITSPN